MRRAIQANPYTFKTGLVPKYITCYQQASVAENNQFHLMWRTYYECVGTKMTYIHKGDI